MCFIPYCFQHGSDTPRRDEVCQVPFYGADLNVRILPCFDIPLHMSCLDYLYAGARNGRTQGQTKLGQHVRGRLRGDAPALAGTKASATLPSRKERWPVRRGVRLKVSLTSCRCVRREVKFFEAVAGSDMSDSSSMVGDVDSV